MATDAHKTAAPGRDAERLSYLVLTCMLAVAGLSLVLSDNDPDLFGRIAYARDAFARGAWIWHTDPYSYTVPGGAWVDHEWGFSWIAFATYQLGGWGALRLLGISLMAVTAWLVFSTTKGQAGAVALRPWFGVVFAPVMAMAFVGPRPQAFSYLCFAWMLVCLARSWDGSPRWLLWAVAPMPLWVNIHGGFLAGLGIVGVWMALRLPALVASRDRAALKYVALAALWCVVSLLLQPWGWDYALLIARAGTMPRPFVPEWNPPTFPGPHWVFAVLSVTVALISLRHAVRRWPDIAVMFALAVLTFQHRRHLPFLAIAVAVFAFPAVTALRAGRTPKVGGSARTLLLRVSSVAVVALSCWVVWLTVGRLRAPEPAEPKWPAAAVEYLKTQPGGGVLVDFDWAQYAIFRASPQFTVAVDGRYEEVYPEAVMQRYLAWHFDQPGWESLPADPATQYALVATNSTRAARLEMLAPRWKRLYRDATASLFVKDAISASSTSAARRQ